MTRTRRFPLPPLPPLLLLLATACSSGSSGAPADDTGNDAGTVDASPAPCTSELPASCPSAQPSYQSDVLPILEERCYACHSGTGVTSSGSGINLGSYSAVYTLRGDVSSEVNGCQMPPSTATPPSSAERATLLGWIVCGAPDN